MSNPEGQAHAERDVPPTHKDGDISKPHILWTMRRSGGTTLAMVLAEASGRPQIHEPFTPGRPFAHIADAYEAERTEEYAEGLADFFAQGMVVRHCFDVRAMGLSLDLARRTQDSHRHVFLLRRDEARRLLSLATALETGAWRFDDDKPQIGAIKLSVGRFRREYKRCKRRLEVLNSLFAELQIPHHVVYFEDIYVGEREARVRHCRGVFEFLGYGPVGEDQLNMIFTREQAKPNPAQIQNREQFLASVTTPGGLIPRVLDRWLISE